MLSGQKYVLQSDHPGSAPSCTVHEQCKPEARTEPLLSLSFLVYSVKQYIIRLLKRLDKTNYSTVPVKKHTVNKGCYYCYKNVSLYMTIYMQRLCSKDYKEKTIILQ